MFAVRGYCGVKWPHMRLGARFEEMIDKLCPVQGIEINGDVFRSLFGPIVYILLATEDKVLYVGKSNNGLHRTCDPNHKAREARDKCISVLIYQCKTPDQSIELERYLIRKFNPQYNIQERTDRRLQIIGIM